MKDGWYLTLLCTILFIAGAWVLLRMGREDIVRMSFVYLAVGYVSAFGGAMMKKR